MKETLAKTNYRVVLAILWLLLILSIALPHCPGFKSILEWIISPYESEYRPETLAFFATVFIASISGSFAWIQYRTLKRRDVLKMIMLYDHITALLNYHVEVIKGAASIRYISKERCISQDEVKMICELEGLIYEQSNTKKNKSVRQFIQKTNEIIIGMQQLAYRINTYYCVSERDPLVLALTSDEISAIDENIEKIKQYRSDLYKKTTLRKLITKAELKKLKEDSGQ